MLKKKLLGIFMFVIIISLSSAQITIQGGVRDDNLVVNILDNESLFANNSFLNLTDTPSSYSGQAGNCTAVNGGETGLTFVNCGGGGGSGDITSVFGDGIYVYNGSSSGDVNLAFNETKLNNTINGEFIKKTLDDLDDVDAPSPADNQFIKWNSSTSMWEKFTLFNRINTWTRKQIFSPIGIGQQTAIEVPSDNTLDMGSFGMSIFEDSTTRTAVFESLLGFEIRDTSANTLTQIDRDGVDVQEGTLKVADRYFSAYAGVSQSLSLGSWTAINWTEENRDDSRYTHSTSTDTQEIRIEKTGDYMIIADVSTENVGGSGRTISEFRVLADGVEINGTRGYMYNRVVNKGFASASATFIYSATANDDITVEAQIKIGPDDIDTIADGTRITIMQI